MFKLTNALKAYAVKQFGVKSGAGDDEFRRVIGLKLAGGKLTAAKLAELTKKQKKPGTPPPGKKKAKPAKKDKADDGDEPAGVTAETIQSLVAKQVKKLLGSAAKAGSRPHTTPTPEELFAKGTRVRVKSAAEQYSTSTKEAVYPNRCRKDGTGSPNPLAGQPAKFGGVTLSHPSDLGKAVSAAWVKWCINSSNGDGRGVPQNLRLTEHDRDLVMHAMHKMAWTGLVKGASDQAMKVHRQKLTEFQVKALLDDSISGGIEVAPIVFDEAIVLIPVLYGELFPFVNVVNIARGRRVKGGMLSNPTFTSGQAEGTAIQPFNTGSFVGAFDTTIYAATGAMEIGLDFEEDSPVDLGSSILEKYGEKALEWLDRVIAVGNGYNEPLGIANTLGVTTLHSDLGGDGPPTVSDYEGLMFGVAKQWRNEPGAMTAFIGSDTSYRRARAIQVGPADERRVFGMTHADYMLLDRPYKVQNDIPNNKLMFANLKRYRMYRRLGLSVRVETQGRALALANTKLLVLRMRYGGQMENGGAMSIIQDGQV